MKFLGLKKKPWYWPNNWSCVRASAAFMLRQSFDTPGLEWLSAVVSKLLAASSNLLALQLIFNFPLRECLQSHRLWVRHNQVEAARGRVRRQSGAHYLQSQLNRFKQSPQGKSGATQAGATRSTSLLTHLSWRPRSCRRCLFSGCHRSAWCWAARCGSYWLCSRQI